MKINPLTPAEEQLMKILWPLGSAYMREIVTDYPEPKPHPNTISTFVKILVEKEFLTPEKEGRIFKYHVAVPFADYRSFQLKNCIEKYFDNSGAEMLKVLLEEKWIHAEDLNQFFEIKTTVVPVADKEELFDQSLSDFVEELTSTKSGKKKKIKKKKKK